MSLYGLNPRQVLLNVGATAVTYAAASRYSQNHPALLSQAAVSLTMALARPFLEKQAPDDKKYFLGSFALIGAVGALCGLSWKVNALASMCLAVGSYTFRLSSVQTGQEPDRAKSNVPPLFKLIIQGFKGVLEFKEQKKEETLKAIQEALSICDKEALFYTTPNDNSLLHIAVSTPI